MYFYQSSKIKKEKIIVLLRVYLICIHVYMLTAKNTFGFKCVWDLVPEALHMAWRDLTYTAVYVRVSSCRSLFFTEKPAW